MRVPRNQAVRGILKVKQHRLAEFIRDNISTIPQEWEGPALQRAGVVAGSDPEQSDQRRVGCGRRHGLHGKGTAPATNIPLDRPRGRRQLTEVCKQRFDNCCILCRVTWMIPSLLMSSPRSRSLPLFGFSTNRVARPAHHKNNHEAGNRIVMNDGESYDMDDAVAALQALHAALTCDLEELETKILALGYSTIVASMPDNQKIAEYHEARAALHSGLSSIAEVLAWIQWKTEEDPEGDVAVAIQPLPTLRGYSIH